MATHVFVRRGGVQPTLTTPYTGPYRVLTRSEATFKIALPGGGTETVSIARLKPAHTAADNDPDEEEPQTPPSPPPPGRRPGPRTRFPEATDRQTRSTSHRPRDQARGPSEPYDPGEGPSNRGFQHTRAAQKEPTAVAAPPPLDPDIFDNQDLENNPNPAMAAPQAAAPQAAAPQAAAPRVAAPPRFFSNPSARKFSRPNYSSSLSAILKSHLNI